MIQYFPISATSSGDNIIVTGSAYPNRRIAILSYTVLTDTDVTIKWVSGANGDISGEMPIAAKGGMSCTSNFMLAGGPIGLMRTIEAEDNIILNLSGAANVGGFITCYVVTS